MKRLALILFTAIRLVTTRVEATTRGLSQIVTPDLQPEGDLSVSLQIQDAHINPYEIQVEIGILREEPCLLSIGFTNWSPRAGVDPQPYVEAGYYTEHNNLSRARFTVATKTRRSSVTPTISTEKFARKSISKAAWRTQPP